MTNELSKETINEIEEAKSRVKKGNLISETEAIKRLSKHYKE